MSCSQFLLEVMAGTTTSFHFTGIDDFVDPEDRNRFIPDSQILKRWKARVVALLGDHSAATGFFSPPMPMRTG
ncbi:hypothetical protein QEP66_07175 [Streptomyces sp. LB8]|uniref:hypothetical protein n=1 Tax=Streptomyces sp. LB8 TaxID=3042509 RepID=UPI002649CC31|nr:hypothetical protein [Streptomyces sp. LB8]MDN5381886.1 hypothetical protein [Streptomyces sp. LB8]